MDKIKLKNIRTILTVAEQSDKIRVKFLKEGFL